MDKDRITDDDDCISICQSGYITPEMFIFWDKAGVIQDDNNLPTIYHKNRHYKNRKINLSPEDDTLLMYFTVLPSIDTNDKYRIDLITGGFRTMPGNLMKSEEERDGMNEPHITPRRVTQWLHLATLHMWSL